MKSLAFISGMILIGAMLQIAPHFIRWTVPSAIAQPSQSATTDPKVDDLPEADVSRLPEADVSPVTVDFVECTSNGVPDLCMRKVVTEKGKKTICISNPTLGTHECKTQ